MLSSKKKSHTRPPQISLNATTGGVVTAILAYIKQLGGALRLWGDNKYTGTGRDQITHEQQERTRKTLHRAQRARAGSSVCNRFREGGKETEVL